MSVGESVMDAIARSIAGVSTVVVPLSKSFVTSVSTSVRATLAVRVLAPAAVGVTVIVTAAIAAGSSAAQTHVTMPLLCVQVGEPGETARNAEESGRSLVRTAFVALEGPWFESATV